MMRRRFLSCLSAIAVLAAMLAPAVSAGQAPGVWKDPDDSPLPFRSDEELIEFLRTAEIESVTDLSIGITNPRRVVLAKDGVTARAALRDFDETYEERRIDGIYYLVLRDSYLWDIAAFRLAGILGLDNIPPVARRKVNGQDATLQIWLEGGLMEQVRVEEGTTPPDHQDFRQQEQTMRVFDTLIGNIDRNPGNILFDSEWKRWLIDQSRSFMNSNQTLYLEQIVWVDQDLFEKLEGLERETLREQLGDVLTQRQINFVLSRRDKMVAHIEELIEERGRDVVFFRRSE